jgi:transcriptional regulator with XRE-family HTH domain
VPDPLREVHAKATPREQLADMLRQFRIDAGYGSHGALARKLNVSRPVITKAENAAHPVPSDALLAAWARATGAPLDPLTELAQRAKSGTPDWFMPYRQAEATASILRCWSPLLVPGLLQAEAYMRAVLSVEDYSASQLDELVAARLERQVVIGRAYLTAVMAGRPRIELHVIPEGTNVGLWGALYLATRDNAVTVCLPALEDVTSTAGHLVGKATWAFERILGAAMPRAGSLDLIRMAEERWKAQI